MKKLALDLGALAVESFDLGEGEETRGTVEANQQTVNQQCYTQEISCYRTGCCPATFRC